VPADQSNSLLVVAQPGKEWNTQPQAWQCHQAVDKVSHHEEVAE